MAFGLSRTQHLRHTFFVTLGQARKRNEGWIDFFEAAATAQPHNDINRRVLLNVVAR
jgi:hypothetical protein